MYLRAGETELHRRTGALARKVDGLLAKSSRDLKILGSRKVEVDLSYIKSKDIRERTLKIMEELIKTYTSVPGRVEGRGCDSLGTWSIQSEYDKYIPSPRHLTRQRVRDHRTPKGVRDQR